MNFERIMNWVMDKLTIYLMWFVGVGLLFIVGVQFGIHKGKELQIEDFKLQIEKLKYEIRTAQDKLLLMEERLKEAEHKKIMAAVIKCESGGKHERVWGDGGLSYGMFQFQYATFRELAGKMGFKNAKWKDAGHQYIVADWAIKNNFGHLWTCYRKIKVTTPSPLNSLSHKGRGDKDGGYYREG